MILESFQLTGKVALVTGSSRGLGAEIAVGFAEAGADVVLVARKGLEETAKRIEALGRKALMIQADLGKPEGSVPFIIDQVINHFGRIDILLNGAGIIRREPAVEFSDENWNDVLDVNLKAPFMLSRGVAQIMRGQGSGKIINLASLLSFQGGYLVTSYAVSKAGIAGLTKAQSNEFASYGIQVTAIAPGYMATELTEALQKDEVRGRDILARIPAGRWGTGKDLQGAAVFLASKASDYVNGHILTVDGGWMNR